MPTNTVKPLLSGHLGRSRRCPLNRGFTVIACVWGGGGGGFKPPTSLTYNSVPCIPASSSLSLRRLRLFAVPSLLLTEGIANNPNSSENQAVPPAPFFLCFNHFAFFSTAKY